MVLYDRVDDKNVRCAALLSVGDWMAAVFSFYTVERERSQNIYWCNTLSDYTHGHTGRIFHTHHIRDLQSLLFFKKLHAERERERDGGERERERERERRGGERVRERKPWERR